MVQAAIDTKIRPPRSQYTPPIPFIPITMVRRFPGRRMGCGIPASSILRRRDCSGSFRHFG